LLLNEKSTDCTRKPLLLFSPLDWGLGHTTRCIPLLNEFLACGWEIIVACNSTQKTVLEQELTGLTFTALEGYNVEYGRNRINTILKLSALPINILTKINGENRWLSDFLRTHPVDAVLSDNRYGFCAPGIPSIFLTHQLAPISPFGPIANRAVRQFLYRYINRFSECWVADFGEGTKLAGKLSHPPQMPGVPVRYIGVFSRLRNADETPDAHHRSDYRHDVLIIISGPEPQRSIFETIVCAELKRLASEAKEISAVLIRGLPQTDSELDCGVPYYNHVDADTLATLARNSRFVVCRSGYTTLMDMLKLKKKMIVVPTPGQTEQEYLASHFMKNRFALAARQRNFNLSENIRKAGEFNFNFPDVSMEAYKSAVRDVREKSLFNDPAG